MILTQGLIAYGVLEVEGARQLASTYLILGELLGGAVFGAGMALTRGCPARSFVLSTNGNLRAIISFAIFALVAYAAFGGRCSRRAGAVLLNAVAARLKGTCYHFTVACNMAAN